MRPVRVTALTTGLVAMPLLAALAFAQTRPDEAQTRISTVEIEATSVTDVEAVVMEEQASANTTEVAAEEALANPENPDSENAEGDEEDAGPPPPPPVVYFDVDLEMARPGDNEAGQAKTQLCAACHGMDGNSIVDMYPRLAGQNERYIARQIQLIANGQRTEGAVIAMLPFVKDLNEQDMRDIGAYYSTQIGGAGVADDSLVEEGQYAGLKFYEIGQKIYRSGDPQRGIPACLACHGPTGAGNPGPPYPSIGGQHAAYVAQRLQHYQAGKTQEEDPSQFQIMATVTKSLTDQEIQALASYLQGLHHRADEVEVAAAP